jgi:L-ribulokinase
MWPRAARKAGLTVYKLLESQAASLKPGESGLLALDWWNGNRSILVDAHLTGLLVGATLATRPHEIYRALIEATAFGTRKIIEAFTEKGIAIEELYACGGLAQKNSFADADLCGRYRAPDQSRRIGRDLCAGRSDARRGGGWFLSRTSTRPRKRWRAFGRKFTDRICE